VFRASLGGKNKKGTLKSSHVLGLKKLNNNRRRKVGGRWFTTRGRKRGPSSKESRSICGSEDWGEKYLGHLEGALDTPYKKPTISLPRGPRGRLKKENPQILLRLRKVDRGRAGGERRGVLRHRKKGKLEGGSIEKKRKKSSYVAWGRTQVEDLK